jgi:myo-inositol-1(or 4)-monophosphatase
MKSLGQKELDEIYAFAVALGKEAGSILVSGVKLRMDGGSPDQVVEKENAVDIVTKTDEGRLDGRNVRKKIVHS